MNTTYRRKPLRYLHYISLFVFLVFTVSSSYLLFFNEHKHESVVVESVEQEQEHYDIIKKYEKYRNETYPIVASIYSSSPSNSTTTMADQIDRHTMIKIHRHLDVIRSTEGENKINVLIHGYDELLETAKGYYLRNHSQENESESEKMVKIQLDVNDKETRNLRILPQPRSLSKSSYFGSNGVPNYPTISFNNRFNCYRNLEGSYMTMDHLESRYPTLVEVISIGDSYLKSVGQGGHDMKVLKLTNKEKLVEKSPMFLTCAVHSREIATAEACARFAEYMLGNYEVNADVTWILDFVEIHMILQANPDGREDEEQYLHYRRKNMNRNRPSRRCSVSSYGTDLNRNFPHSAWGTTGVSNYKCSDVFAGVSAGSEIETQNIVNYIETVLPPGTNNQKDPDTNAYLSDSSKGVLIDVHSYWQAIFWPWAYNENIDAPNDVDLEAFAKKVASTASPVYVADNEVYPTSGDTTDWAHESIGVAALTIEIGTEFYQDCESSEDFIFDNARKMLLYGARVSMAPYELPKGPDITSLSCSCYKDEDDDNNLNSNSTKTTTSTPLILVVDVTASDSQYALDFHTGQNRISSIDIFMDHHPYDKEEDQEEPLPSVYATMGNGLREFTLSTESTSLIIPIPNITSSSDETAVGRHTIFIQASDDKETKGPVYASYLTISPSGQCECDDVNNI